MMQSLRARTVLVAVLGVMVLSLACTQPQATPAGETGGGAAAPTGGGAAAPAGGGAAAEPKVKRVVFSINPPGTFSVALRDLGSTSVWPLKPMYEYLMDTDPKTRRLVPGLAESWTIEPDGKSIRFKLRKGIQFQDGWGEMTAKDVVWAREDLIQEDSLSSIKGLLDAGTEGIDVINDYEVVWRLVQPDADILDFIGNQVGGMEINSKKHFDAQGKPTPQTKPIAGTGPYVLKEYVEDSRLVYERAPAGHWRFKPDFPELEIRFAKEASTRLASLLAGEAHITNIPYDLEPQAKQAGMKLVSGQVPGLRTFFNIYGGYLKDPQNPATGGWMYPESPVINPKVREALNVAINRDELNKAFFKGVGGKMYMAHVPEGHGAWNPRWKTEFDSKYGYDPERAKKLLAEAGYTAGRPLETNSFVVNLSQYSGSADLVEAVAAYWRAVGVNVNLLTMDDAARSAGQRGLKFDNHFALSVLIAPPVLAIRLGHHTSPPRGGSIEDPVVEEVFEKARRSLDIEKQDGFIREASDRIYDTHMSIPLFWLPVNVMVNPKVVDDWVFPGSVSGTWTHMEGIKAAR